VVVKALAVGKRFSTFTHRPTTLKERLVRRQQQQSDFWALRDVTLEIEPGQTVGLIGANGSGKSTLLKILAGILRPTTGTVDVTGRIASLLELGAGFNGELTGRENVYLNAAILGLTRREVDKLFDAIVDFAELEPFIDGAVKHYSSGMYVRLGFAVAVHVDPDVLLVDEVLAVGDEAFAAKCLAKIKDFQAEGRTILVVSHSLDMISNICDRTVVLSAGRVVHDGDADEGVQVLRAVLSTTTPVTDDAASDAPVAVICQGVELFDGEGRPHAEARPGEALEVHVRLWLPKATMAAVRVVVTGHFDVPIFVLRTLGQTRLPAGDTEIVFAVDELPPLEGTFSLAVGIEDAQSGAGLAAARYEHRLHLRSGHGHGLLDVPHTASVRRVGQ
jgi:ABC-2 type transport system ATP-binding protein